MTDLAITRGDSAMLTHTVTRGGPVDLRLPGTKLWFTAKRKLADQAADAVLAKTYEEGIEGGISVLTGAPGNVASTELEPADTAGLAGETLLEWDLQLLEPDGTRTTLERGRLLITLDVTT